MNPARLPSDFIRESDRHRGHTYMVTVWQCRECHTTYDAMPWVGGLPQCPGCGADDTHLNKRRIRD